MNLKFRLIISVILVLIIKNTTFSQDFWQQCNGPEWRYIYRLITNSAGHIFAGTSNGIYRSVDNGNDWTLLNNGLPQSGMGSIAVNDSGYLFNSNR